MTKRILLLLLFALSVVGDACAFDPKSMKDCRLAFLLGMSTGNYRSNREVFWGSDRENECKILFDEIARAYAKDDGATDEEMRTEKWRTKVMAALAGCQDPAKRIGPVFNDYLGLRFGSHVWQRIDVVSSYAAGAYARYGTATGFKMVDQPKGLYLIIVVRALSSLAPQLTINPGIPGNLVITLSGGGRDELQEFFEEMKNIREALAPRK